MILWIDSYFFRVARIGVNVNNVMRHECGHVSQAGSEPWLPMCHKHVHIPTTSNMQQPS